MTYFSVPHVLSFLKPFRTPKHHSSCSEIYIEKSIVQPALPNLQTYQPSSGPGAMKTIYSPIPFA